MDKKSLVIGALGSALLFVTMGAANPVAVQNTVPVEHVWEFHLSPPSAPIPGMAFAINKKTGEVRKYNSNSAKYSNMAFNNYSVVVP